jgi:hypothetical protein
MPKSYCNYTHCLDSEFCKKNWSNIRMSATNSCDISDFCWSPDWGRCRQHITCDVWLGWDREVWSVDTHGRSPQLELEPPRRPPPVETTPLNSATAAELPTPVRPAHSTYIGIPRASAMSLAAAASASASPSSRFPSPATAARRRFLHHLLAAPPRPPQLRHCSPYHWMAVWRCTLALNLFPHASSQKLSAWFTSSSLSRFRSEEGWVAVLPSRGICGYQEVWSVDFWLVVL